LTDEQTDKKTAHTPSRPKTDERTDRQKDISLIAKTALHRRSAVKTSQNLITCIFFTTSSIFVRRQISTKRHSYSCVSKNRWDR